MPTIVLPDPPPAEFEQLLERRRLTGADRHDEVWKGVLHMAPAAHPRHSQLQLQVIELLREPALAAGLVRLNDFNLGEPDNYRVPDGGLYAGTPDLLYLPTAALILEVLSPGDETWGTLPFYATQHVDEIVIVDPDEHTVQWLVLQDGEYLSAPRSEVLDLDVQELAGQIDWPA